MRCIRWILNIKWCGVLDLKLTNEHVRTKFNDISSLRDMVTKKRILFLDRLMRMPYKLIPARSISAFLKDKKLLGRLNTTPSHTF